MEKVIAIFICICFMFTFTLAGCGDTKVIDGTEYDTYGLLNEGGKKNPSIEYRPIWGNIVWGVILVETIIAPIYFFGFSMFEPIGKEVPGKSKGAI